MSKLFSKSSYEKIPINLNSLRFFKSHKMLPCNLFISLNLNSKPFICLFFIENFLILFISLKFTGGLKYRFQNIYHNLYKKDVESFERIAKKYSQKAQVLKFLKSYGFKKK